MQHLKIRWVLTGREAGILLPTHLKALGHWAKIIESEVPDLPPGTLVIVSDRNNLEIELGHTPELTIEETKVDAIIELDLCTECLHKLQPDIPRG